MAGKKQSKGTCAYCKKALSKGVMSKHLASCKARKSVIEKADQQKGAGETLYHLRVQDSYRPEFWLNLEMCGSKKLRDLDSYLRSIWLECCDKHAESHPHNNYGDPIELVNSPRVGMCGDVGPAQPPY